MAIKLCYDVIEIVQYNLDYPNILGTLSRLSVRISENCSQKRNTYFTLLSTHGLLRC